MPGNGGMVDIGDYAEVRCKDQSEVTDTFDILKLVCLNQIYFARAIAIGKFILLLDLLRIPLKIVYV